MAPAGFGGSVEGTPAVAAAVAAGRVRTLHVERGRGEQGAGRDVVDAARRAGVEIVEVDSVLDLAATDAPQGLVATATPIPFRPLDELLGPEAALLVLDHLEDPRNVGAMARSALAAGMTGLVVAERRAAPLSPLSFKAAAGALEHLPVAQVSSVADCASRCQKADVWTVGLAAGGERSLFRLELFTEPVAVFVGAVGEGLGRLVTERLDLVASIPMAVESESLNASVAAALACFEVRRARSGDRLSP